MSTGPWHYAEAERLLAAADADVSENMRVQTGEHKADVLAAAQVHATLALTAATTGQETLGSEWRETLGYAPRPRETPRPDPWDEVKP